MALHRFDVRIPSFTQLPEDELVNTWHFEDTAVGTTDYDNVRDLLLDFYDDVPGDSTFSLSSRMSSQAIGSTWRIIGYNLAEPEPRYPVYESTMSITDLGTSAALPPEVALVLSFESNPVSGEPQARRRNRKFIGGFGTAALENNGRPAQVTIDIMRNAAAALLRASALAVSWDWKVYSPTNDEFTDVDGGWVDNSFDTQRRRGHASTARGSWISSTGT